MAALSGSHYKPPALPVVYDFARLAGEVGVSAAVLSPCHPSLQFASALTPFPVYCCLLRSEKVILKVVPARASTSTWPPSWWRARTLINCSPNDGVVV